MREIIRSIALVLFMGYVAAQADTPATKPSTRPATIDRAPYLRAVWEAQAKLAAVRDAGIAEWRASPEYAKLSKEVEDRRQALVVARVEGTPQERLDASLAYNKARLALDEANVAAEAAIDLSAERAAMHRAEEKLAEITDQNDRRIIAIQRAAEEKAAKDPIQKAIREKRLVIGMTLDQAKAAFGSAGRVTSETERTQFQNVWATFRNGKIVAIDRGSSWTRENTAPR